jgi:hypothetical protein
VRRALILSGLLALAFAWTAHAQVLLNPNGARQGTRVEVDARPGGTVNEVPGAVTIALARGFRIDTRSVGTLCTTGNCPESSRIGRGHTEVTVSNYFLEPDDSFDVISRIDLYLTPAQQPGDIAGIVARVEELLTGQTSATRGRIVPVNRGAFGTEIRFAGLPAGALPSIVTVTFKRLRLFVQAERKVKRKRRKVRYHLIRNPRRCRGSWPYEVRLGFSTGTQLLSGAAPCRR